VLSINHSFFVAVWNTVSLLMDPYFRSRVMLLGDKERLFNLIDRDCLPPLQGGTFEFDFRDWIRGRYEVEGWGFNEPQKEEENKNKSADVNSLYMRALQEEVSKAVIDLSFYIFSLQHSLQKKGQKKPDI